MTYPISKIDGLTAFAGSKLKSAGIRTMESLLEAARTAKGRKKLSAETGFSEQQLLEWANLADCMRIPGMGKAKAELLRASGVNTVRELTHRNPSRLAQAMRDANDKRRLVQVLPSEKTVEQLIQKARKLPLKISY
jgi:predicted RecB family nuclease